MKVYITSTGSYSSYRLDRVFATEELARDYVAFHQRATEDFDSVNDEVIEAEVLEAPVSARVRYSSSTTFYERPPSYSSAGVDGWSPLFSRATIQVRGDPPEIYEDDPREEIHVIVRDNKNEPYGYSFETYGRQVGITVAGWDKDRVVKVLGEVKAQKAAELAGI